ncbi:MAG: class IV adenylate cyclase, partial [Methanobrevibacter sp.]|nr:class IV adenylate cyclase [Methanobrevibacter sp.]
EVEMNIESAQKAKDIFEEIGFKEARTVRKNRQYYTFENFEISLDDVEGLSPYMEIEIGMEDGEDYSKAQDEIFKLFEKLGITDGFERTSYMELLENI